MSNVGQSWWDKEIAHAQANLEAMEADKKRPVALKSYFDVLAQWDEVRHAIIKFGGKFGATRFGGEFDLQKVVNAYMNSPEARAEINRIAGKGLSFASISN